MTEAAQLVGGPADGRIMAIPELWQYINIAIPPQISFVTEDLDPSDPVPFKTGMYRVEIGPMGKPSRNDHGELRYLWQGER